MAESNAQVPWLSGLVLEGEVAEQYQIDNSITGDSQESTREPGQLELDGLAPITIFVGANNSGKSRLMREFFILEQPSMTKLEHGLPRATMEQIQESDAAIIERSIQSRLYELNGRIAKPRPKNDRILESDLLQINHNLHSFVLLMQKNPSRKQKRIIDLLKECGIEKAIPTFQSRKRSYVPILRGMRPPLISASQYLENPNEKDPYEQRTLHDYFKPGKVPRGFCEEQNSNHFIFSGLGLYSDLRRRLLAPTQTERDTVRAYQDFLAKHFFPGQNVTMVPAEYPMASGKNDVVHIKIGTNDDYPIHQLGDGMQSLIICTYPIVTETEPGSLFFLEEPDLCMHPSLQRTFLEVLKEYHRKMGHQFIITTHSNHLLDLMEDNELVSIFGFSEITGKAASRCDSAHANKPTVSTASKPKSKFRIRPSSLRDRQILLELGVRPSATYLGPPEKGKPTAAQLVSAIETR